MSALPDDPEHFLRWYQQRRDPNMAAGGFAVRRDYGAYVIDLLSEALDANPGVAFDHVRTKVTDIAPVGPRWELALEGGTTATADAIVLALGMGPPSVAWAPPELIASPHFIADPWAKPVAEEDVPGPGGTVLLVGAGLTMADMAITWGRGGATVHAASRHGLMPLAHAQNPPPKRPPPAMPDQDELTVEQLTHFVFTQLRAVGDWRLGTDSLRSITQDLWRTMPVSERRRALAGAGGAVRRWSRVRSRVAPEIGGWLDALTAEGRLIAQEGTVTSAHPGVGNVEVRLTSGEKLRADVVVNCTGPANDPAHSREPFIRFLISSGIAQAHPVGIGFDVDEDGWLNSERNLPPIIAIGPMRQGELWESVAIPELREQAAQLPKQLFAVLS
jgi:uncharacterized NAD(P)/FAD-binding protein YdhS